MNTPAHAIINLLILSRNPDHPKAAAIIGGALLPDLVIVVFYAWQQALGTAETQIWSVEYYRPIWQAWIDSFNSIPIISFAILVSWYFRQTILLLFFASMLLHCFGDLPLHHDDAHRHFFPFIDWRFASPVSYWDPAYYGRWFSVVEFTGVVTASIYMYWRFAALRPWVATTMSVYLLYGIYVYLVWV